MSKDSSGDGKDNDSGMGQSHRSDSNLDQSDIIVFGTDVELPDLNRSMYTTITFSHFVGIQSNIFVS